MYVAAGSCSCPLLGPYGRGTRAGRAHPQGQRLVDGSVGWFPSNLVVIREDESVDADDDEDAPVM